jgi:Circularly permutated YpsA SLOG family
MHSFTFTKKAQTSTPDSCIKEIVSGGQTGVDRAALDVAIKLDIAHGGWCPYERLAEDGVIPSSYNLKEVPPPTPKEKTDPNAIYKKRTELNARDSDGTLIILNSDPIGGTLYTIEMLNKHNKPYIIYNLQNNPCIDDITNWVIEKKINKLNVAGPRESQAPGIYLIAIKILEHLLNHHLIHLK